MNREDLLHRRCGYLHLYGVSALSVMLATKRGLDVELASVIAMLHDIYSYRTRLRKFHAHNSEEDARVILRNSGLFTDEEQRIIRSAIFKHSDKDVVDQPYDELLKDADVTQHYLYNPGAPFTIDKIQRLQKVFDELALPYTVDTFRLWEEQSSTPQPTVDRRAHLADLAEGLARKPLIGNEHQSGSDVFPLIRYFPGAELNKGFDWCASFVYHCCMEAGFVLPIKYPNPVPCRFAGVLAWLVWAQLPENQFYYSVNDENFEPARGDIVIFDQLISEGAHDHIGIVLAYENGVLTTAEGNVENCSGIFTRDRFEHVNGFIRIENTYHYEGKWQD